MKKNIDIFLEDKFKEKFFRFVEFNNSNDFYKLIIFNSIVTFFAVGPKKIYLLLNGAIFLLIYYLLKKLVNHFLKSKKYSVFIPLLFQYLKISFTILLIMAPFYSICYGIIIGKTGFGIDNLLDANKFSSFFIFVNWKVFLSYIALNLIIILILYSFSAFRKYALKFINYEENIVYVNELYWFSNFYSKPYFGEVIDEDLENLEHYKKLKKSKINKDKNYLLIIFIISFLSIFFPIFSVFVKKLTIHSLVLYLLSYFQLFILLMLIIGSAGSIGVNILSLFIHVRKNKLHLTNEWAYIEKEYIKKWKNGEAEDNKNLNEEIENNKKGSE